MLKVYLKTREAVDRLRANSKGEVSFEYIIVVCVVVLAVAATFGTTASGALGTALTTGLNHIATSFATALSG